MCISFEVIFAINTFHLKVYRIVSRLRRWEPSQALKVSQSDASKVIFGLHTSWLPSLHCPPLRSNGCRGNSLAKIWVSDCYLTVSYWWWSTVYSYQYNTLSNIIAYHNPTRDLSVRTHLFEPWGPGVFSPNVDVWQNADRRRWNLNSERRT